MAVLLTILAIDAFRTVFESTYFGLYFNSLFGLLPKGVHDVLSRPAILIIPKLINVVAGLLVLFLLIRRWVPREIREREEWIIALQESEERVRNLLNSTAEAIYGLDLKGRCTFCNPACLEILGYEREDELLDQNMHNLIHHTRPGGEHYPAQECLIYKAFQDGKGVHNDAEVLWRKDKTSFPAEYWSYPLRRGGRLIGSVVTFLDITERKALEERLRQSQKMEAIGQLAGGIAHDYNNMLGVIIGNIQMVEGSVDLDENSRQRLDKALAAAQRNADLTAKLLGFSRPQAGATQRAALNDSIENLKEIIATSLTSSIRVEFDLSDNLWPVDIDPGEFEDMLLNLAINARDAMPDGGVLSIGTTNKVFDDNSAKYHPGSQTGEYVMMSVSDTGSGISEEVREQIFDPFFSTKETGKGTGLGLSMVYAFVQRSGGFIIVHSEPGEGTSFGVFLPRARAGVSGEVNAAAVADHQPSRGSETILVVDDEEFLVDLAVEQLEDLGYQTLSARNGEEALDVLKAHPDIDLLFSDITMPGKLDGYDLALAAMQLRPSLKILLASGFAKERDSARGGDDASLVRLTASRLDKPYTLAELRAAVRRSLDEAG